MNPETAASSDLPAVPFSDDVWEDLLNYIEEKRVIPIVGPELLKVETETVDRRVAAVVGAAFFSALTIHDSRFTILLDVFLVALRKSFG